MVGRSVVILFLERKQARERKGLEELGSELGIELAVPSEGSHSHRTLTLAAGGPCSPRHEARNNDSYCSPTWLPAVPSPKQSWESGHQSYLCSLVFLIFL